jgi:hypothetical protein
VDPAGEEPDGDVDGRKEQQYEDGELDEGARLFGSQQHSGAAGPEGGGEVGKEAEAEQSGDVDAVAGHVHAPDDGGDGDDGARDDPADDGSGEVAGDDAAPGRRGEEEPAGEAGPEVAGDGESGEYSGDGGGLERGEDEDEGGIPERVDLPRAFRTAYLRLIYAADCCSRYSSWTCRGLRY